MKIKTDYLILAAAIIIPFGLVALGLWKTYELMNKKDGEDANEPQ